MNESNLIKSSATLYMTVNVLGYEVEVHRWEREYDGVVIYNAYVEVPNSRYLKQEYLGYDVSLREKDVLGIDTAKTYMDEHDEAQKLSSALRQIQDAVQKCIDVLEKQ